MEYRRVVFTNVLITLRCHKNVNDVHLWKILIELYCMKYVANIDHFLMNSCQISSSSMSFGY